MYLWKKGKKKIFENVTEEEFIQILMESGKTEKQAKLSLRLSKILGSYVRVGDRSIRPPIERFSK